ncbi:MAG: OmpA family protein [candidate division Zixibacteria bacterium]|nr:OmpA family protein [candidate division Zixibacteria bacterium]
MVNSRDVYFDLNEYKLSAEARGVLDQMAQEMTEKPNSILEIIGQTDALGSTRHNFWLGERRAEEAKRYLRDKFGIPLNRLQSVSDGKAKAQELSAAQAETGNNKDRKVSLNLWQSAMPLPQKDSGQKEESDIS